jgi:hypothetical protein
MVAGPFKVFYFWASPGGIKGPRNLGCPTFKSQKNLEHKRMPNAMTAAASAKKANAKLAVARVQLYYQGSTAATIKRGLPCLKGLPIPTRPATIKRGLAWPANPCQWLRACQPCAGQRDFATTPACFY